MNGQQYHDVAITFLYEYEPLPIQLSPTTGPVRGQTEVLITGTHLDGNYRLCLFGMDAQHSVPVRPVSSYTVHHEGTTLTHHPTASNYPTTSSLLPADVNVSCVTPPSSTARAVHLTFVLNGQQYSHTSLTFEYTQDLIISSLSPASGPTDGDMVVRITGGPFAVGDDRRCRFGVARALGSFPFFDRPSPPPPSSPPPLSPPPPSSPPPLVAPDRRLGEMGSGSGEGSGGSGDWGSGSGEGSGDGGGSGEGSGSGYGSGVVDSGGLLITVASIVRATYVVAGGFLECRTTPNNAGYVPVEITLNGQQWSNTNVTLIAYEPLRVSAMSPNSGPVLGGTLFLLYGRFDWNAGVHRQCRFDAIGATVPATSWCDESGCSNDAIVCKTPLGLTLTSSLLPLTTSVEISMNAQQFTTDSVGFSFYPALTVSGICPTSGPVSGETSLRVIGTNFFSTWESRCKFESANFRSVVQSSHIDTNTLTCVTPNINTTSLLRDALDVNLTAGVSLYGGAAYLPAEAGAVTLNRLREHFSVGTLTIDVHHNLKDRAVCRVYDVGECSTSGFAIRSFVIDFTLSIVAGSSTDAALSTGDGFSFSYGDIPYGLVSERGAGLGLRVQFRQYTHNELSVHHLGRPLLTTNLSLPTNGSTHVQIVLNNAQLSLTLGGLPLIHHLPIIHWNPIDTWRMVFGARTGASTASHELRDVSIKTGPHEDMHAVTVELSANTQQYTTDNVLLSLLPIATYGSYSPSTGASGGGIDVILFGTNLRWGSDYKMKYNGSVVNATYAFIDGSDALLSVTPQVTLDAPEGEREHHRPADVMVSLNGQQYYDSGTFGFYEEPSLLSVSPNTGPVGGSTLLRVSLSALRGHEGSALICRFGAGTGGTTGSGLVALYPPVDSEAYANPSVANELLCRLPPDLPVGGHAFEISLNAQEFTSSNLNFTVYDLSEVNLLSPSSGPTTGDTSVRVFGAHFTAPLGVLGSHYLCKFEESIVGAFHTIESDASLVSYARRWPRPQHDGVSHPDEIYCRSPPRDAGDATAFGPYPLEVSLNGQNYTESETLFTYYSPPEPLTLCPSSGPIRGETTVRITGREFALGSDYRISLTPDSGSGDAGSGSGEYEWGSGGSVGGSSNLSTSTQWPECDMNARWSDGHTCLAADGMRLIVRSLYEGMNTSLIVGDFAGQLPMAGTYSLWLPASPPPPPPLLALDAGSGDYGGGSGEAGSGSGCRQRQWRCV